MAKKQRFDFSSESLDGIDGFDEEEQSEQPEELLQEEAPSPPSSEGDDGLEVFEEEEDIDLEKNVAERLQVATLYGLLLKNPLFQGQRSSGSARIEKEVRLFIQGRLKTLLGLGGEPIPGMVTGQFAMAPQEVEKLRLLVPVAEILLGLAEKLTSRGLVTQNGAPTTVAPAVLAKAPPAQQVTVSAVPQTAPQRALPATLPAAIKRPAPPIQKSQQPKAPVRPQVAPKQTGKIPVSLDKVDPAYREDPSLEAKNGQWFVVAKDADGNVRTLLDPITKKRRPFLKNVTIQVPGRSGPQPLPTPSVEVYNQMSMMSAASAIQGLDARLGGMGQNLVSIQAAAAANKIVDSDEEERP